MVMVEEEEEGENLSLPGRNDHSLLCLPSVLFSSHIAMSLFANVATILIH